MGFYSQSTVAMTRFGVGREKNASLWQIATLQKFVRLAIDTHQIRCFVVFVRDSPRQGEQRSEARSASASIARQGEFLNAVIPIEVARHHITLPDTSAYSGTEVVNAIRNALDRTSGRTMLISSALDRVVRTRDSYDELCTLFESGDHMAMSLLWDPATIVEPTAAMLLPAEA